MKPPEESGSNPASCYQSALPPALSGSSCPEEGQPASVWSALRTDKRNATSFRCLLPRSSPACGFLVFMRSSKSLWSIKWTLHMKLGDQPASASLPHTESSLSVGGTRAHLHRAHTGRLFPPNILTSYFPSADILQPLQTPRLGRWLSLVATSYWHCWVHSKLTAHTTVPRQLPKKNKVLVENRAACPQFRRHTWERRQPCHLQFNLKFPQLVPSVPLFYRKPQSSLWGNPTAEVRVKRCNVLTIPLLIAVSDFKGTEHWNGTKGSKWQCLSPNKLAT